MIWGALTLLLTGLVILIFLSAALAPFESLGWYAGWQTKDDEPDPARRDSGCADLGTMVGSAIKSRL